MYDTSTLNDQVGKSGILRSQRSGQARWARADDEYFVRILRGVGRG